MNNNNVSKNVIFKPIYQRGIWEINLNYTDKQINAIINKIYELEKLQFTQGPRTFIHKKGFNTGNLIDLPFFKPLINDVLRLVNNELALQLKRNNQFKNIAKDPNFYFTTDDLWGVIWRKGDYNLPHRHPDNHIAGAFYFKIPTKPNSGGNLAISNPTQNQLPIHDKGTFDGMSIESLSPQLGKGILFRADLEHFVLPSYTDEDRICIAFNFKMKKMPFSEFKPVPNWKPLSINYTFPDNDNEIQEIKNTGKIKYKLADSSFLELLNPYKGDIVDAKGKKFTIFIE
jgi:uncharacterized protein (TIGR02466 family)